MKKKKPTIAELEAAQGSVRILPDGRVVPVNPIDMRTDDEKQRDWDFQQRHIAALEAVVDGLRDGLVSLYGPFHIINYRAKSIGDWHEDKNLDVEKETRVIRAWRLRGHRRISKALDRAEVPLKALAEVRAKVWDEVAKIRVKFIKDECLGEVKCAGCAEEKEFIEECEGKAAALRVGGKS